ncbi:hypothetical protein ACFY8X_20300 [Streptomyces tanashiensis]|uniref:hypothetical protein n=1 Tax=Streptomyces tanashiensis TaxID=67367 RepID=UPI0036EDBA66
MTGNVPARRSESDTLTVAVPAFGHTGFERWGVAGIAGSRAGFRSPTADGTGAAMSAAEPTVVDVDRRGAGCAAACPVTSPAISTPAVAVATTEAAARQAETLSNMHSSPFLQSSHDGHDHVTRPEETSAQMIKDLCDRSSHQAPRTPPAPTTPEGPATALRAAATLWLQWITNASIRDATGWNGP